jgi:CRP/FNR family transcriptional regulator, cyclic AMP receptor protein
MTWREYQAGDTILREGDVGETAYIIQEGEVEVSKSLDGRKIHLAFMGKDEIFGEMGMIEEKPRSATVTAVERTVVRELHRRDFYVNLQKDPGVTVQILKVLFERLRQAHATILELQQEGAGQGLELEIFSAASETPRERVGASLEGLTPEAVHALEGQPFIIGRLPFLIGRKSNDPLAYNHLTIVDEEPFQISRHHVELMERHGRVGALDRGSYLGSLVDGQQLGGPGGHRGPLFFKEGGGELVLGNPRSPFRFSVTPLLPGRTG